jgi:hypothetical protein
LCCPGHRFGVLAGDGLDEVGVYAVADFHGFGGRGAFRRADLAGVRANQILRLPLNRLPLPGARQQHDQRRHGVGHIVEGQHVVRALKETAN